MPNRYSFFSAKKILLYYLLDFTIFVQKSTNMLLLFSWRKCFLILYFEDCTFVFVLNWCVFGCLFGFELSFFFQIYSASGFLVYENLGYSVFNSLGKLSGIISVSVAFNPIHLSSFLEFKFPAMGDCKHCHIFFSHPCSHTPFQGEFVDLFKKLSLFLHSLNLVLAIWMALGIG